MRILFIGYLSWGATSDYRMRALWRTVDHVCAIDLCEYTGEYIFRSFIERVELRLGWSPKKSKLRDRIVREVHRFRPDLVWLEQCSLIDAQTIAAIREIHQCTVIHYTPDSLRAPGMTTPAFLGSIRSFDAMITTKHPEVDIYYGLGAKRVLFTHQGYEPCVHYPRELTAAESTYYGCDLAFAGQCMGQRRHTIEHLARRVDYRFLVYGRQWKASDPEVANRIEYRPWVFAEEYAKAICGAKITLCFLNRNVGDTHTTRTFEIPACGSLMIAERTPQQLDLFAEDEEAVYFDSPEELTEKVEFYLRNESVRQKIAWAGQARSVRGNYTWQSRVGELLKQLGFELPVTNKHEAFDARGIRA